KLSTLYVCFIGCFTVFIKVNSGKNFNSNLLHSITHTASGTEEIYCFYCSVITCIFYYFIHTPKINYEIGFVCYLISYSRLVLVYLSLVHIRKQSGHSNLYLLIVQYCFYLSAYSLQFYLTKIGFLF